MTPFSYLVTQGDQNMKIKSIKFIEVERFAQQYQRPYKIDVAASIEGRRELDTSNFTEKLPILAGNVMTLGPGKPAEIEGGWNIRRHVFVMTLIMSETQKLVRELIVSGYVNDLMKTDSIEHTDGSPINPQSGNVSIQPSSCKSREEQKSAMKVAKKQI